MIVGQLYENHGNKVFLSYTANFYYTIIIIFNNWCYVKEKV